MMKDSSVRSNSLVHPSLRGMQGHFHPVTDENSHSDEDSHAHHEVFHSHAPVGKMRTAFFLTIVILLVELLGGWISHSLALLSDAGHVLTDLAAIGLSWYALQQSQKPPTENLTYGYYRSGILAALANGVTLIVIALVILWQAYGRLLHPQPVEGGWMMVSAGVGMVLNLYLGLGMGGEESLNIRSTVLHMLGDAAASAGVIVAAVVIGLTHWYVIDPLLSVLIGLLVAFGAWRVVRQTVTILMEGTPRGIAMGDVVEIIRSVPGVIDVHDLHLWSITSGRNALSCHVVLDGSLTIRDSQDILRDVERHLTGLGVGHITVQTEDDRHPHEDSILCCDDFGEEAVPKHGHDYPPGFGQAQKFDSNHGFESGDSEPPHQESVLSVHNSPRHG